MTINKILTASFVLGALAFSSVNAEEVKSKQNIKSQEKITIKKTNKEDCISKMFKEMDKDNDGFVTKKEHKKYLEKKFEELDTNKDGVITKEEFIIKEKIKTNKKGTKIEYKSDLIFKEIDKNEDGKIKKKEYIKFKQKEFEKLDKDGDKKVSFEEFKAIKQNKSIKNKETSKEKVKIKEEIKK